MSEKGAVQRAEESEKKAVQNFCFHNSSLTSSGRQIDAAFDVMIGKIRKTEVEKWKARVGELEDAFIRYGSYAQHRPDCDRALNPKAEPLPVCSCALENAAFQVRTIRDRIRKESQ